MSEPQNNQEQTPAPISSVITKTKTMRIKLEGESFLAFHNISGRIVFPKKMSERASDEVLMKVAIRLLQEKVEEKLKAGEIFVLFDSL